MRIQIILLLLIRSTFCQDNTYTVGPSVPYYDSQSILKVLTVLSEKNATHFLEWRPMYYNHHTIIDIAGIKYIDVDNFTELHILQGSTNYQRYCVQQTIPIPAINATDYTFRFGDYNGDGFQDLYCIQTFNTESGFIEISVLDAIGNFQNNIMHTVANVSDPYGVYDIGDNNGNIDLYYISNDTGEVQVFSEQSGYIDIIYTLYYGGLSAGYYEQNNFNTPTAMVDSQIVNTIFVSDFDGDGYADLNRIKSTNYVDRGLYDHEVLFETLGGPMYESYIADSLLRIVVNNVDDFEWFMGRYKAGKHKNLIGIKLTHTVSGFVEVHIFSFKAPHTMLADYAPAPTSPTYEYNQCTYCKLINWDVITFNGTQLLNNTLCPDFTQCFNNNNFYPYTANAGDNSCVCCYCGEYCCTANPSPAPNPTKCLFTDVAEFCRHGDKFIGVIIEQITDNSKMIPQLKNTIGLAFQADKYNPGTGSVRHEFAYRMDSGHYDFYYAININDVQGQKDTVLNNIAQFSQCSPMSRCIGEQNGKEYCKFKGNLLYKIFNNNKAVCAK